jgi:hypothetical protein
MAAAAWFNNNIAKARKFKRCDVTGAWTAPKTNKEVM